MRLIVCLEPFSIYGRRLTADMVTSPLPLSLAPLPRGVHPRQASRGQGLFAATLAALALFLVICASLASSGTATASGLIAPPALTTLTTPAPSDVSFHLHPPYPTHTRH